jgi:hypothetical protein
VPLDEIADAKNDFNLNLPRYIDSSEPEDLHDITAHLRGGIPERDLDAADSPLAPYWQVMPGVRAALFESAGRPGYVQLRCRWRGEARHPGPRRVHQPSTRAPPAPCRLAGRHQPVLSGFGAGAHPKALIADAVRKLLAAFRPVPLIDAYDVYQHLMDYWAATMQDDAYLIAADGWVAKPAPHPGDRQEGQEQGPRLDLRADPQAADRGALLRRSRPRWRRCRPTWTPPRPARPSWRRSTAGTTACSPATTASPPRR